MVEQSDAIYFPLVVTATGIFASFICQFFAYIKGGNVEFKLKVQLWVSTLLLSAMLVPCIWMLPEDMEISFAGEVKHTSPW
jgi:Na+/H+-translocating membrane pyrophosphatase